MAEGAGERFDEVELSAFVLSCFTRALKRVRTPRPYWTCPLCCWAATEQAQPLRDRFGISCLVRGLEAFGPVVQRLTA